MNQLGNASGGCADSNLSVMPSCSYPFMVRFRISSQSRVISYERRIFNYFEQGHSIYTHR
jgi:hypothetical protein